MTRKEIVHTIEFEPTGQRGKCRETENLLACARRLGIGLNAVCGGFGTCHSCRVQVLSGTVSERTSHEEETFSSKELEQGWRLACQSYPKSDCKLNIPPASMSASQRIQLEGTEAAVLPEPAVHSYPLELLPPSWSSPEADGDRLLNTLNKKYQTHCHRIDLNVLKDLSPQLRSWKWKGLASVRDGEVISVRSPSSPSLGLAVDIGTTKIASYLVDLNSGITLASQGVMNPQIGYGEDVISRVTYAVKSQEGSALLQKVLVEALNQLAGDLCNQVHASPLDILEAVVVGNTVMHHLFLGLPVKQLALSPFIAAVSSPLDIKARDLELRFAPGAYVHLLPNIGGFVGADHVAMLLATDVERSESPLIAVDIGTNTEVSLFKEGRMTAVSCASGPVFEGGHIKDGMRAGPGAIERVRITGETVYYQTIDGLPPAGICGSGILDAVAQLYAAGVLDESGRMKNTHPRVRSKNGALEFILYEGKKGKGSRPVVMTQHDIREIQLGKAAIRAGIQSLLEAHSCSKEDIRQVIIAGAFGTYIDLESAIMIGMLPDLPKDRFKQVGNAAGMGAKQALVSVKKRLEARSIASKVNYLDLAATHKFKKTFIQSNRLGRF